MPAYNKQDLDRRMHGALDVFKHDLAGLRTGRASTIIFSSHTICHAISLAVRDFGSGR